MAIMAGAAAASVVGGLISSGKASDAADSAAAQQRMFQQQDIDLRRKAAAREEALYDPVANIVKFELMKDSKAKIQEEMAFQGSLVDQAYAEKMREMNENVEQTMPGSGLQAGLMTGMRVMNAKDKALAMYTAKRATEDSIMSQRLSFIGRYSPTNSAALVGQGLQAAAATAGAQWQTAMQAQASAGQSIGSGLSSYATYLALSKKG